MCVARLFTRQVREGLKGLPCVYPSLEPLGAVHVPAEERPAWVAAALSATLVPALSGPPSSPPTAAFSRPPTAAFSLCVFPRVAALYDCVDSAMAHHKYSWAKTTCDILVK
eukprot:4767905-Prymnesium_polylepis.1